MRSVPQTNNVSENLDALIERQQQLAARFARTGPQQKARAARSKLLTLLNQRDLSKTLLIQNTETETLG
jgi:hypothetical protein